MNDIFFKDIEAVTTLIDNREVSPVELTELTLERIKENSPSLCAFITVMEKEAIAQANQLEDDLRKGKNRGFLHGIPIAVKDIIQTKGTRTTAGSKVFQEWVPDEDATVIKKLKNAGAIIIGKTNLHEFAMGATTENPHFGNAKNPWNSQKTPGGSSGGSAIAVATGMAFGAVGTDTAGSIRLPAAMCGTVGMKPTYDLVSREGSLPFSWSLDHIGPMTRTVKDASIMLEVMKGNNEKNHSVLIENSLQNLQGVKLGFHETYMFTQIDKEMKSVIMQAFKQFEALGAEIVPIDLPKLEDALEGLKTIAQSEALSFHEPLLRDYGDLYGEDLKYRFQFGKDISATDYIRAHRIRKKFIEYTMEQMIGIDALIGPTNVQPPLDIGTMVPEQAISNMFTLGKTPLANILGFPSLSIACGFTTEILPVGLQLIGKPFSDQRILEIGDCYERSEKWSMALKKNKNYIYTNQL